jgi:outer membrane biosynthesis protein TonB
MKSPGGGGKNPGIQKQPMKPQQKPARPTQEKPAYSPSPKQQYREAQKPARKPEMKPDRKPERSPQDRKRIAMLDRLKNRQGTAPVSQPGATGETTAPASSGGRRSCCLGCTVYAMALPVALAALLFAII